MALAPGILGAIALLVGAQLIGTDPYLIIRFAVAILALVIAWFVIQAKQWWWVPVLAAIAVVWNPVLPLDFSGALWAGAHYVAAAAFIAIGILVKSRVEPSAR